MSKKMPKDEQEQRMKEAKFRFEESVEYIDPNDIDAAASSGEAKIKELLENIPKALETVWNDIKLLVSVIKDYTSGEYREIPFKSIAAIAGAIIYFVSPIDAIPDFIPGVGYLDDASVIAYCLRFVHDDLEAYKVWKGNDGEKQEELITT